MHSKKDHPGVYIPPPLFYVAVFLLSIFLQAKIPLPNHFFGKPAAKIVGGLLLVFTVFFYLFRSLKIFFQSKNTVITALPATSLQTIGIYAVTRNPMYMGLLIVYLGLACFIGNWWTLILLPLLILIVQGYIIRREEKYLQRRFGNEYLEYKRRVRRWI